MNHAISTPVVQTAIRVALFVGTILAIINHGPSLIALELSNWQTFQIGFTYLVPYCVSTYSSVKMLLRKEIPQKEIPRPNEPMVEQAPHRHQPANPGSDQ